MEQYILIVTSSYDTTVDFLVKRYSDKYNMIRLNLDELDKYKISITNDYIYFEDKQDNLIIKDLFRHIKSIYFRTIFLPSLDKYEEKYRNYMQKEIYNFIIGLVDSFEGKVLSKPTFLRQIENKVYQLFIAKKLGFNCPNSIISNDSNFINKKIKPHEWIAKPLSTGKITKDKHILTNIVNDEINNIEFSPTYFQTKIDADYELRITFIDNNFYTVKISSEQVDWRNNNNATYEFIKTPKIIFDECMRFINQTNLKFGAFDYMVKGNIYYFLECNPNGQWLWLENKLNLDISNKIMRYLDA